MFATNWGHANLFSDMEKILHRVERVVAARSGVPFLGNATPALNVWESDEALVVTGEIPGVDADSIAISVMGDTLTLSGKRVLGPPQDKDSARTVEFNRSIQLPYRVDPDHTEARTRDGVLTIVLRRPDEEKPRKVTVKVA